MHTSTGASFPKAAVGAGALAIALGLLPLAARTPEVAGVLLTASVFAAIPLVVLVAAILAGRSAAHEGGGTAGNGARIGLFVGIGVLLGTVIGFTALGAIAGNIPAVQGLIRASEPHPDARIPYGWIAPLGAATGALVGVLAGLVYLIPATLGGLLGATLGMPHHRHTATPQAR